MPVPRNGFKHALANGKLQIGCWLGLADPYVAEISALAGFDCLTIDAEHAPNDLRSILAQLQVISGRGPHAIVRPPVGATWMIKQLLDAGVQTLLIPMVESADQARDLVAAVTYPPHGVRGVGAALARASHYSEIADYAANAQKEICLMVQIESVQGLAALPDILAVRGVDGVFIGPSDLAADMGYMGDASNPNVKAEILTAIQKIATFGKAAGIFTRDVEFQVTCYEQGARFIATESDVILFADQMRQSAQNARHRLGQM